MGRQSRLKKMWRIEKALTTAEPGDPASPDGPRPLSDLVVASWATAVLGTWLFSILVAGSSGRLALATGPFLAVVAASSLVERRRGRRLASRVWIAVGALWYALVVFPPTSGLREFFAPLFRS